MSKYPVKYTSSKGVEWEIEAMPDGHLHNAARKMEAAMEQDDDAPEGAVEILRAMKQEIAERDAARPPIDPEAT